MEVRGIAGGVTVVDDFGHHPTAIRENVAGLAPALRAPAIWAVFEPREQHHRRNVFQKRTGRSFRHADAVLVRNRASELLRRERLDPQPIQDLQAPEKNRRLICRTRCHPLDACGQTAGGDVICVFQQREFGGHP